MERRETKALQLPFAATPPPHTKKALDLCGLYAAKSASLMSKETIKLWSQTVPKNLQKSKFKQVCLAYILLRLDFSWTILFPHA